jgi:hypothetical protein
VLYNPVDDYTVVTLANSEQVYLADLMQRVSYLTHAGTRGYDQGYPTPTTRR